MTTGYLMVDQPNPYTAQGTYPRRGVRGQLTGTCILHTTEGAWTAGVQSLINLVRSRSDYGCYHRACDWQDIAMLYPWEWETWQDSETNNWAVGISAACRTSDWAIMPADVREGYYRNMGIMAADFVNYMKTTYGITVPLARLSGDQARAGVPGFCAHGDSGIARSDPGAQFDWAKFFNYTRQALGAAAIGNQSSTPQELFTMAQFEEVQRQQGLTHAKLNNIAEAVNANAAQNQKWHGETHGKVNALTQMVVQLTAKQGVPITAEQIKQWSKEGAAEALAEGIVTVDVTVQGKGAV